MHNCRALKHVKTTTLTHAQVELRLEVLPHGVGFLSLNCVIPQEYNVLQMLVKFRAVSPVLAQLCNLHIAWLIKLIFRHTELSLLLI